MLRQHSNVKYLARRNPWWQPLSWFERKKYLRCQWVEPIRPGSPRYRFCERPAVNNNLCDEHLASWELEKKIEQLRKRYEDHLD